MPGPTRARRCDWCVQSRGMDGGGRGAAPGQANGKARESTKVACSVTTTCKKDKKKIQIIMNVLKHIIILT